MRGRVEKKRGCRDVAAIGKKNKKRGGTLPSFPAFRRNATRNGREGRERKLEPLT